jgi:hypothetical protein
VRIFVAYSYRSSDEWIEDLVVPLIRAFGDIPITGKEIFGQNLDDGVRQQIAGCDGLIGFATQREPIAGTDLWTTHQWVQDELVTALNHPRKIPFIEVRDVKVQPQSGLLANRARINYEEATRDRCLLNIAETLSGWHKQLGTFEIEMLPDELSENIRPIRNNPDLRCVYHVLESDKIDEGPEIRAPILPLTGGRLATRVFGVPQDAMIRVEIWFHRNLLWSSELQAVESRKIFLMKEKLQ